MAESMLRDFVTNYFAFLTNMSIVYYKVLCKLLAKLV